MIIETELHDFIKEQLVGTDYFVVDLRISVKSHIAIEIDSLQGVTIQDCVNFSRKIEAHLDAAEEIYSLEVASPDLSKPLRIPQQYSKNIGRSLKVVLQNDEQLEGELIQADEESFVLHTEEKVRLEAKKKKELVVKDHHIKFTDLKSAHIIISFK